MLNLKLAKILASVFILIGLAFPISNLISDKSGRVEIKKEHGKNYKKVLGLFEQKCIDCHSSKTKMPFYANFPIAKQTITADIKNGIAHLDMEKEIFSNDGKIPEKVLAQIEHVMLDGSMPPFRYLALHPEAFLSGKDKKTILNWLKNLRASDRLTNAAEEFKGEVIQPIPQESDANHAKADLGKRLYHSTSLSGDNSVSCASCHGLDKGGTDQLKYSIGIKDQEGHINAPSTFNSSYNFVQFWDGRAATLQDQAAGPVTNDIEMGASWSQVIRRLENESGYSKEFNFIYPNGITKANITDAIAEFEKSLITPNSRFDRYLMGDKGALTKDEIKGYELFKKDGCIKCHYGIALGGQSYEKMGLEKDYFKDRGDLSKEDNGRFNVTQNDSDKFKFKVPILRNVELSYPYFHDGSTSDLKEAVKTMSKYQLGKNMSNGDASKITKFLKTLTGTYEGKALK